MQSIAYLKSKDFLIVFKFIVNFVQVEAHIFLIKNTKTSYKKWFKIQLIQYLAFFFDITCLPFIN